MEYQVSSTIAASAEKIFAAYTDVAQWSVWDKETESASLNGAFVVGAEGKIKPKDVAETKIYVTEVTPNRSLTTICKLPLCVMHFVHELTPQADGTTFVVNKLQFTGLLAPLFGRLIGKSIAKTMPESLAGLKGYVEG